jgi:hypothetical protein
VAAKSAPKKAAPAKSSSESVWCVHDGVHHGVRITAQQIGCSGWLERARRRARAAPRATAPAAPLAPR